MHTEFMCQISIIMYVYMTKSTIELASVGLTQAYQNYSVKHSVEVLSICTNKLSYMHGVPGNLLWADIFNFFS